MNDSIASSSIMLTNPLNSKKHRFFDLDKTEQLDINIDSRLERVRNCCSTCNATWKEWDKCIKDIIYSINKKPYECINVFSKSLIKMQNLSRNFFVDVLVKKMEKDGTITSFFSHGLNKSDINPFTLIKNESKRNKFISILDSEKIKGSAG